jgi:hypothetical protein
VAFQPNRHDNTQRDHSPAATNSLQSQRELSPQRASGQGAQITY